MDIQPQEGRDIAGWRARAACQGEDPELFFPIGTSGPAMLQTEQAKAVCKRCSVTDACLQWAIESGSDAGVWGGQSEEERRATKQKLARAIGVTASKTTLANAAQSKPLPKEYYKIVDLNNRGHQA